MPLCMGVLVIAYWKKVEQGIKDAAALFPDLKVVYTGPDVFNFEQFMAMLDAAIAAEPDGLLATMTNPEAMDELLRAAIADGLPVIAIDSPDARPPLRGSPTFHILAKSLMRVGFWQQKRS